MCLDGRVVRTAECCCIKRTDKHFNILDKNAFFNDLRGGGGRVVELTLCSKYNSDYLDPNRMPPPPFRGKKTAQSYD